MTRRYARIANRTVADEYDAVSRAVENLYNQPLPETPKAPKCAAEAPDARWADSA
jgi:hypothetical protein